MGEHDDEEREDYFDYDCPPERDWGFLWRTAAAVSGLLVMLALAAVVAVVLCSAFLRPPVAAG